LLEKLNEIPGVSIPLNAVNRRPSILISPLQENESLQKFFNIYDWVISEIKAS